MRAKNTFKIEKEKYLDVGILAWTMIRGTSELALGFELKANLDHLAYQAELVEARFNFRRLRLRSA